MSLNFEEFYPFSIECEVEDGTSRFLGLPKLPEGGPYESPFDLLNAVCSRQQSMILLEPDVGVVFYHPDDVARLTVETNSHVTDWGGVSGFLLSPGHLSQINAEPEPMELEVGRV